MKVGEISEAIKKNPDVEEAYSSNLIDWITNIQLAKKRGKVLVTLELPLDILKNPNDVREFDGVPILTLVKLK